MTSTFKLKTLLLVYSFMIRTYLVTANNPYEVIKFKVPHSVWKQALHPTPILKSPVTIVVPINVQDSDNIADDEFDEDDDAENVVIDTTMITDNVLPEINTETNPVVDDEIASAPVASNATETVVQNEVVQQDVPGQLIRFPCSCLSGQCGCCTGTIMERFNMKACGNMTFIPEDFVFDVRLSVNNNTVVRQRVSASDPPPICFNPRRAPFVRVCAEISNIRVRNGNTHACLDINADIGGFPVYSRSFKCFSFGSSGIKTGQKPKKPVSSGPKPVNLFNNGDEEGGFIQNTAETLLGQGNGIFGGGDSDGGIFGGGDSDGGLFGGGDSDGGLFGGGNDDGDDGGPLDEIGDVLGDFLDGRSHS